MDVIEKYKIRPARAKLDGKEVGIGGDLTIGGRRIKEATAAQYKKLHKIYPMLFEKKKPDVKDVITEEE